MTSWKNIRASTANRFSLLMSFSTQIVNPSPFNCRAVAVTLRSRAPPTGSDNTTRHSRVTRPPPDWLSRIALTAPHSRHSLAVPQPSGPTSAFLQPTSSPGRLPNTSSNWRLSSCSNC